MAMARRSTISDTNFGSSIRTDRKAAFVRECGFFRLCGILIHRMTSAGETTRSMSLRSFILFVCGSLILFSRKPDSLLNPQFWAEDGRNWYADAYNVGPITALFTTEAGYYQTISRLIAGVSLAVPLEYAPLVFNASAILIQVGVAMFIVSDRCRPLLEDIKARYLLALMYLLLPNAWEVFGNLTNSQWHLALLVCLVVVASEPTAKLGRAFDLGVTALAALSGPFCLLLLPVACIQVFRARSRYTGLIAIILAIGCLVQAYGLLTTTREVQSALGATFDLFFQIVGRHIVLGPLVGIRGFLRLQSWGLWGSISAAIVTIGGMAIAFFLFAKASASVRLIMLYAAMICVTALAWPAVTLEPGQWTVIASHPTALRYWFVPGFAFYLGLIYLLFKNKTKVAWYLSVGLLLISLYGVIKDFRIDPLKDLDFKTRAVEFENAPSGTVVTIPINPDWKMELTKK